MIENFAKAALDGKELTELVRQLNSDIAKVLDDTAKLDKLAAAYLKSGAAAGAPAQTLQALGKTIRPLTGAASKTQKAAQAYLKVSK